MNKLEKLGAKIISQLTIDSEYGWPPDCVGFIYQPERPACSPDFPDTDSNDVPDKKVKKEK